MSISIRLVVARVYYSSMNLYFAPVKKSMVQLPHAAPAHLTCVTAEPACTSQDFICRQE